MGLSNELISQFVKITNDTKKEKKEAIVYGTVFKQDGVEYVKIDGSDRLTPVSSTTAIDNGERVTVMIKDHTATVTGNISSPSAKNSDVANIGSQISEFEIVIADKVSTKELEVEKGRIDDLTSNNIIVNNKLTAAEADISELTADNVNIKERLTAREAEIDNLKTTKLSADVADIRYASIDNLDATTARIDTLESTYGDFEVLATNKFVANDALIDELQTNKLSATDADLKYANIDFSNIGSATMQNFYANSGLIENVVVENGTITGNLIGVTIKGDLIEGNTIVAEKLVIKGSDGLYYKLNTNGTTTEAEQTNYNSLNGSIITAKSITATKISVTDLVAFGATIGGFKITNNSIYSGVKDSSDNTTRGIYLDSNGQLSVGDGSNFIRFYKDTDNAYKLAISASSIILSSTSKTIEETIDEIKGELTYNVEILSTNGNIFKNGQITTKLMAIVRKGNEDVTNTIDANRFRWTRVSSDTVSDTAWNTAHFGGTKEITITKDDVKARATFNCEILDV